MYRIKPFKIQIAESLRVKYNTSSSAKKGQKHSDIMIMAEELLLHKENTGGDRTINESTLSRIGRYSRTNNHKMENTLKPVLQETSLRRSYPGNVSYYSIPSAADYVNNTKT